MGRAPDRADAQRCAGGDRAIMGRVLALRKFLFEQIVRIFGEDHAFGVKHGRVKDDQQADPDQFFQDETRVKRQKHPRSAGITSYGEKVTR